MVIPKGTQISFSHARKTIPWFCRHPKNSSIVFLLFHPHPDSDAAFLLDCLVLPALVSRQLRPKDLVCPSWPPTLNWFPSWHNLAQQLGQEGEDRTDGFKRAARGRGGGYSGNWRTAYQELPKARGSPFSLSRLLGTLSEMSSLMSCLITSKSSNEPDLSGLM